HSAENRERKIPRSDYEGDPAWPVMLVTFLAGNVLGQPRFSEESHLMRVEETKIHCFADVPVGFGPRFADLENFDRRKFEPATIEDGGHTLEQLAAFFEWRAAPRLKRASRRFRCALGFGNSGLSNQANDLIWRARIQRRQQLVGPNFFAINHDWVLLSETRTHFAQSGAHFFLGLGINKICQRSILVGIAGWHLAVGAVAARSVIPSENASPARAEGSRGARNDRGRRRILAVHQITRITQQLGCRNMFRELRAQESFIRGIFKEATHQVRHPRQQFAHWRIFPDPITHLDQRALDWTRHSVEQLEFETAAIDSEFFRQCLRVRDATDVVRPEGG